MKLKKILKNFFIPKFKFAITSAIATGLDYSIYIILTTLLLSNESVSHVISYTCGMIVNFILQKRFIFLLKRKLYSAFGLSILFSLIGWILSQGIFNALLYSSAFFESYDLLAKVIVTALIFFYNFYTKRYSFEKKLPMDSFKDYL